MVRDHDVGSRDVREWLSTFPFPPIPIYSIPIPSHLIPNFLTYSHSHGIPVWAIPIPSHSHSQVCVLFPFPWDSHGIPGPIGNPIPMHISSGESFSP